MSNNTKNYNNKYKRNKNQKMVITVSAILAGFMLLSVVIGLVANLM